MSHPAQIPRGEMARVGFHDITSVRETLQLDQELARNIELVQP